MIRILACVLFSATFVSCASSGGPGAHVVQTTETRLTRPPSSKAGLTTLTIGKDALGNVVSVR